LLLALLLTFSQDRPGSASPSLIHSQYIVADKIYHEGELTSDENKQELLDAQALEKFRALIRVLEKENADDSLAFYIYFKAGVLEHSAGNIADASRDYNAAIAQHSRASLIPDSILFKAYLYSGAMYYSRNLFDSALMRYKQAETIATKYQEALPEASRLYNSLGVLYYETGNYSQGGSYFKKSIATLSPASPYYEDLLVNYKINLAQMLVKEESFVAADSMYRDILHYKKNMPEIFHNLGIISLRRGNAKQALEYFRKLKYDNSKDIRLYNDMANAFLDLGAYDSSAIMLQKALLENSRWNLQRKNVAHGLTFKLQGDLFTEQEKYPEALRAYQQSIFEFDPAFMDTSIKANPLSFSGIFSYINLFNALTAKAAALEKKYEHDADAGSLEQSLHAYQSAFKLTEYVARTYASDEARLFLDRIKYIVHSKPIDISIRLYELTGNKDFLSEAYRFDQLNKASVLSLSLQENLLEQQAGIGHEFLAKMAAARTAITNLSLAASKTNDSIRIQQFNDEIRDREIEIASLQENINSDERFARLQPPDRIPSVSFIRQKMLDDKTALLSYHLSENRLLILCITKNGFNYSAQNIDNHFFDQVAAFVTSLHEVRPGKKYDGDTPAKALYTELISPILKYIASATRLVIIPDDELNYVPFEALKDGDNEYLLKSFSIQYQYSTALLHKEKLQDKPQQTIAFAPFVRPVAGSSLATLEYSNDEVKDLHGKILAGEKATKKHFLEYANQYSVIHLATHATANDSIPLQSFISFYPDNNSAENSKLYAEEIYNMKLDSTDLVILSACETGTGKLIRGEGLMSLSRAFSYAGCPNIITSLWQAEDKTTAFLTQRLHKYLDGHLTRDEALQKAKLDLLSSNDITPSLKTPNYWAHLVIIGNYQPAPPSFAWAWIAAAILVAGGLVYYLRRKRKMWK
jgi:CHAT domain-containing protein/tetratricopeptide (TPR) repeat protein